MEMYNDMKVVEDHTDRKQSRNTDRKQSRNTDRKQSRENLKLYSF